MGAIARARSDRHEACAPEVAAAAVRHKEHAADSSSNDGQPVQDPPAIRFLRIFLPDQLTLSHPARIRCQDVSSDSGITFTSAVAVVKLVSPDQRGST